MNHSKECACKHEDDGRMFWILDSGASTHFTPHHSDFVDYVKLKGDRSEERRVGKECVYKHEDDGGMFWILDSGASTHFILHCLDCIDYIYMVYIGVAVM